MSQKEEGPARGARPEDDRTEGRRTKSVKVSLTLAAVFVVVVGVVLAIAWFGNDGDEPTAGPAADPTGQVSAPGTGGAESRLVRADSHRLSEAKNGNVTFVEFLDFECEACGLAYPVVEQLREEYAGDVTFVARYYPIASHFNGERAARAVEAAAQQGRFEQMYQQMFETQEQWGGQRVPADDTFRGFAEDLGLDMAAWDKAYQNPATLDRVKEDAADGKALGVQGTPTFFVNGKKLTPRVWDDLGDAIDAALAR
ncbi:DsbA family protein [Actinopolymorpha pittospori]|uniref:Protein-disulfide isomerase n=1 Tax=Actinopolymorpha pittospori TaxID=648752 RepID=A0A927R9K6_9ACTN|nr:thioredoxin domain-containing protein [Actinopolymorpha pittospori]MBE1606589.1 protein-disulfide isomerase [Actinopolymorpha pittospori]